MKSCLGLENSPNSMLPSRPTLYARVRYSSKESARARVLIKTSPDSSILTPILVLQREKRYHNRLFSGRRGPAVRNATNYVRGLLRGGAGTDGRNVFTRQG